MSNANEAIQFAKALEKIGRQVLLLCEGLPDDLLLWTPPFSESGSLLEIATDLARDIENCVLIPIGGRQPSLCQSLESRPIRSFTALSTCYRFWIKNIHAILDPFPNSFLDLFVETHELNEKLHGKHRPTVHACLLLAMERSAFHWGKAAMLQQSMLWSTMPLEHRARGNLHNVKLQT